MQQRNNTEASDSSKNEYNKWNMRHVPQSHVEGTCNSYEDFADFQLDSYGSGLWRRLLQMSEVLQSIKLIFMEFLL